MNTETYDSPMKMSNKSIREIKQKIKRKGYKKLKMKEKVKYISYKERISMIKFFMVFPGIVLIVPAIIALIWDIIEPS